MAWIKLHSEIILAKNMREHHKTRLVFVDYLMLGAVAKQNGALINPKTHLPLSVEDLSKICDCKVETIEEINKILVGMKLIDIKNKIIVISDWDKYRDDYTRQKPTRRKNLSEAEQNSWLWLNKVFMSLYKENIHEEYVPGGGDLKNIKRMLKTIGGDKLTEAVTRFFMVRKTDNWLKDKGATVTIFITVINQMIAWKDKPVSPFVKEI